MKSLYTVFLLFFVFATSAQKQNEYPSAPTGTSSDMYFDRLIEDPYQWMENPDDPRLQEWLSQQKKINTKQSRKQVQKESLLRQISTMYSAIDRETIKENLQKEAKKLSKYEFKNDYVSYNRSPDLMYRLRGSKIYKKLIHIKKFQANRDDYAEITGLTISEELDLVAVEMGHGGSDWRDIHFYDLTSGEKLTDTLKNLRSSSQIIWNGNGCYYDKYDEPVKGRKLLDKAIGQTFCYHKMGASQNEDTLLFENPDLTGTDSFSFFTNENDYLFFYHYVYSGEKTFRAISTSKLTQGTSFTLEDFMLYPDNGKTYMDVSAVLGNKIVLKSNWNAPNGKVLLAEVLKPNQTKQIAPEYDVSLVEVNQLGDKIACVYRNKGQFSVLIYNLEGELLKKMDFPEGKKINGFSETDLSVDYTFFSISSFYHPPLRYQLSLTDFTFKPVESVSVPYDAENLETRYVNYTTKDGTQVPMYVTCLKSTVLNGENATLLYGYGGYGTTVEPQFNPSQALWLLHGGILAIPNIRGGGAGGSDWGGAGRRLNKQNAIDDFIAAAEYLIEEKYTNPVKLAISGGSHGGLLVGATITQRPELFKAAIAEAGAFDMLRFENFTVGSVSTNIKEFGSVAIKEDFENLLSYSPLHNIKENTTYPNILLITGDKDDRVPPLHSYKFLATLQEKGDPKSLYQLYLIPGAGHGGALTDVTFTDKILFKYYFLFNELDVRFW